MPVCSKALLIRLKKKVFSASSVTEAAAGVVLVAFTVRLLLRASVPVPRLIDPPLIVMPPPTVSVAAPPELITVPSVTVSAPIVSACPATLNCPDRLRVTLTPSAIWLAVT